MAHAVTLRLPSPLYEHFQSRADRDRRSLESVLLEAVAAKAGDEEELSPDLARSIAELELLTDDELWRAARNGLPGETKDRLEELNFKQQREGLTATEKELLEQLVCRYDEAVLMRAEAARILKQRGVDVSDARDDRGLVELDGSAFRVRHQALDGRDR